MVPGLRAVRLKEIAERVQKEFGGDLSAALEELPAPEKFDARIRAYLLVKRHGQELCGRTKPKCGICPVARHCAFGMGKSWDGYLKE
jgi:endonuclease III